MHWSAWAIQRFETLLRPFNKVWKRMELHNIAKCGIGMPSYICSFAICGWLQFWQKIQTIGECLVGGGSILMISSSFLFDRILKLFTKTKNLEESCPKAQNSFFSVEEEEPLPCLRREMRPGALDLTELNHCPEKQVLVWTIEKTTIGILQHQDANEKKWGKTG